MKNIICALVVLSGFSSCFYDNEEELYPMTGCDSTSVSFSATIVPILEQNCYVCHDAATNTNGVTLEGHNNVLPYATNGSLIGVVTHTPGYPAMPQNASKLIDCHIAKIRNWISEGALDN